MLMKVGRQRQVSSPEAVARVMREILHLEDEFDQDKEHFWVLGLNTRNVVKYIDLVSLDTLNSCPIHARETFRTAILKGVNAIIIVHNHPSNTLEPSTDDEKVAKYLADSGKILNIAVLDSVIITEDGYYSFREHKRI